LLCAVWHRRRGRRRFRGRSSTGSPMVRQPGASQRQAYSVQYKLQVVREALRRPPSSRIKPTCREHPGIEPVQLRKWIRNLAALELAGSDAKHVARLKPSANSEYDEEAWSSTTEELDTTYSEQLWLSALNNSRSSSPLPHHSSPPRCGPLRPLATLLTAPPSPLAEEQACAAQELLSLRGLVAKPPQRGVECSRSKLME